MILYLVMLGEVVVGNGDGRGALDDINKPIRPICKVTVVHPNITWPENVDAIPICPPPLSHMCIAASNHRRTRGDEVVNVDSVNDDVGDELQGEARASSNVDVVSSAVNRFEAKLLTMSSFWSLISMSLEKVIHSGSYQHVQVCIAKLGESN